MPKAKGWTCQRVSNGIPCKHKNLPRSRKCAVCGKPRPPKRRPKHMSALELTYEEYVEINGGNVCGICRTGSTTTRKLDRDHSHTDPPYARGLLHARCNRALPNWVTPEWLRAAADYLERAEGRIG